MLIDSSCSVSAQWLIVLFADKMEALGESQKISWASYPTTNRRAFRNRDLNHAIPLHTRHGMACSGQAGELWWLKSDFESVSEHPALLPPPAEMDSNLLGT